MSNVIVTGANSFVGKALVRELLDQGMDVYAVVGEASDTSGLEDLEGSQRLYRCNMDRYSGLSDILPLVSYDACVHLAWAGSTGQARADWQLQLDNASYACDLVGALAAMEVGCFIGVGTLAELDVMSYTPVDGATPNAVSIYGAAKIAAQLTTKAVCADLGVGHIWCRLVNVYGPGNYTGNFIGMAARRFLEGERASFTEGLQAYDFVYVEDVARALVCVINKGHLGCTYLVGSGDPKPLREYIMMIRDAAAPDAEIFFGEVPFNGNSLDDASYGIAKLVEHTGYVPRMSFDEGISKTLAWFREAL